MADLFTAEQAKRLFGFIGAGGTAGALLGPVITIWLSVRLGPMNLLVAAIILIEAAVFCVGRLERVATIQDSGRANCDLAHHLRRNCIAVNDQRPPTACTERF
jgi:ATP:ADP antiporter, AAA family